MDAAFLHLHLWAINKNNLAKKIMELSPDSSEPVDKKPILTAEGLIQSNTTAATSAAAGGTTQPEKSAASTTPPTTATSLAAAEKNTNLTVSTLDIEILPVIYDIVRCVEKDPLDNTAKQRESQECSQKILELQKRFDSARAQIKQLTGIDYNKEDQLQRLELLRNQLRLKQELIRKYKDVQF